MTVPATSRTILEKINVFLFVIIKVIVEIKHKVSKIVARTANTFI